MADDSGEWKTLLLKLVADRDLRARVGRSAKNYISRTYGRERLGFRLGEIMDQCIDHCPRVCRTDLGKHRLMLVNTLYPPQSMGGATRIVKDLVDGLLSRYGDQYEIRVFTCDIRNTQPYQIHEYVHQGVVVTSISVPMRPDLERLYEDDRILEIFGRTLGYFEPDIVHFHSIQRLTASTLLAARASGIPYVVTLHDSWWISDHPFMIDDDGVLLPQNVSNPLLANDYSADLDATITRNRYLRDRLSDAEMLIAVSSYQRTLYVKNGFEQTRIIENGVSVPAGFTRNRKKKLVLGYAGGKSVHKGFYFLKDNITRAALKNIEVVSVDLFAKSPHIRMEKWGDTPVEIHPRFEFSRAGDFYSLIDVMVVPSLWPESFGLVAREASLLGLWVVVPDAGGLSGTVIEGESGHVFALGDSERFQNILAELDRDWKKYKQLVAESIISTLGIKPVEQNVDATHQMYQKILQPTAD
jgi:glycosyltransferase involved in cell wall biosynthesis